MSGTFDFFSFNLLQLVVILLCSYRFIRVVLKFPLVHFSHSVLASLQEPEDADLEVCEHFYDDRNISVAVCRA